MKNGKIQFSLPGGGGSMVSNIDQDEPSENCSIDDRNVIEQGITHEAKDTTVINTKKTITATISHILLIRLIVAISN